MLSSESQTEAPDESTCAPNVSRQALLTELESLGINVDSLQSLTVDQLSTLLYDLSKAADRSGMSGRSRNIKDASASLSTIDKKILRALLESHGIISSLQLSRNLQFPLSTIQRRRKRLEERFVQHSYSLKYDAFSRRHITFVISLGAGDGSQIAREIQGFKGVLMTARIIGSGLDLKAEAIVKTNAELSDLAEKIRSVSGVQNLSLFEPIEVFEKNKKVDLLLIDSF